MNNTDFERKLTNMAVIGAAGKMGRGIVLCLLQLLADQLLSGKDYPRKATILAIDTSDDGLRDMMLYLKKQLLKYAERNIIAIRQHFADDDSLVENAEHIDYFIREISDLVLPASQVAAAANAEIIFEATPENVPLKVDVLKKVSQKSTKNPWILSNTSSIPIHVLSESAKLNDRVIGFHFYNPPPVQKLIEVIPARQTSSDLHDFAKWLASSLRKTAIYSSDTAGFIGNGIFIRELHYALQQVDAMSADLPLEDAILLMDEITRRYLVRPMGIFQLADYVGLDVCVYIAHIMQQYLDETFDFHLFEELITAGIKGGQFADGSQKDGLFKYQNHHPAGVYSLSKSAYTPLPKLKILNEEGDMEMPTWKSLQRNPGAPEILQSHFARLSASPGNSPTLAMEYLAFYRHAGQRLLDLQVAKNHEDINKVMTLGFHQLYGPFNPFTEPS